MKRILRIFYKIYVHGCNLVSNLLPDDPLSQKLRILVLNSCGNRISFKATFLGGGYVAGGGLTVGDGCFINRGVYFDLTGPITMMERSGIGHGTTLITASHDTSDQTRRNGTVAGFPIEIGQGAGIGANVTIFPGVIIGEGALVCTCSLVNKNVSPDTAVSGSPARFARRLETSRRNDDPEPLLSAVS